MIDNFPFYFWVILGFILGFGIEFFIYSNRRDGVIHIYKKDEEERYLFEFNIPPENIPKMKQVVFYTKEEDDDSQNLHAL